MSFISDMLLQSGSKSWQLVRPEFGDRPEPRGSAPPQDIACRGFGSSDFTESSLFLFVGKDLPISAFINEFDAEPFSSESLSHFLTME